MKKQMKNMHGNCHQVIPFPNAATPRELLHNFLDKLLVAAMGAGVSASVLFLVILGH